MPSTKWPTIPDPGTTTDSLFEPVRALKMLVEMIIGLRGGAPARLPVVYRDYFKPGSSQSQVPLSQIKDGDFFIDRANADKLNYWDAAVGAWKPTT